MRFFFIVLAITSYTSSLHLEEPSFKFTFGSNLGSIPIEINKMSKNIKKSPGIKIDSWILSPNFSSIVRDEESLSFLKDKNFKENLYIKFNFKF